MPPRDRRADGTIVVGYDGSLHAGAALRWAQRLAGRDGTPVVLVHVYEWGTTAGPVPVEAAWPSQVVRRQAVKALNEVLAGARDARPDVPVTGWVVDGTVVPVLSELSGQAQLLVIGNRGLGGFPGLRAGSVALDLVAHSRCPVVVVRGSAPAALPVMLGVDEHPAAEHTVSFAYEQARLREVGLTAVHVRERPATERVSDGPPGSDRAADEQLVTQALGSWPEKYPDVPTSVRPLAGDPGDALVTASRAAQLVVVGATGSGGTRRPPPGSTARQLVLHAHCPVAVVHPPPEWSSTTVGGEG